jgi:hypothetical protein
MSGLAMYWALLNIPGLTEDIQKIINFAASQLARSENIPVLKDAGPVLLAFIVAAWLPRLPIVGEAEAILRRILYEHAAIPAQQLRERNRLKGAVYVVNPTVLEAVRDKLEAENFERSDIVYDRVPTGQSLWTKASLLIEHIERWEQQDKYMTAFAILKECDRDILTVTRVKEAYEALKGDARTYFRALHAHPDEEETKVREAAFQAECKELLSHIYNLLSRVSLKSHHTDRDRIACMSAIGFQLTPRASGPVPVGDDLAALALILGVALAVPLAHYIGFIRAIGITATVYAVGLIPILIAYKFPKWVRLPSSHAPAVAFPFVSGLMAWICGFAITLVWGSIHAGGFTQSWSRYWNRSYPWGALYILLSMLIAWRMRTGTYPDISRLKGLTRYQEWGNLCDAAIFGGCTTVLMVLYIVPQVKKLWPESTGKEPWIALLLATIVALIMGFIIPTWYRANLRAQQSALPVIKTGDPFC